MAWHGWGLNARTFLSPLSSCLRNSLPLTSSRLSKTPLETSGSHIWTSSCSTYPCKWPSLGTPPLREKTGCCRGRWQQLEAAVERGLVRAIGVSKWSVTKLKQLLSWRPVHVPAVNQVEAHPHWRQDAMLASCKGEVIHVSVASNLHQSAAQVALRWGILRGMSVLPKSSSPWHIEENIGLFDWSIPPLDFHALCMIEPQRSFGTTRQTRQMKKVRQGRDAWQLWRKGKEGEGRLFLEPEKLWDDEADTEV
ncbi:hypothetical protein CLOP_g792 [Closterium sp. NIES-67]|nr:hypothetical protein CLOP_g792 [Closterium sp. NIES-67]